MTLTWLDWLLMLVYFGFVLGVGVALKRYTTTSAEFFQAGRAMPAWICGLAFISANLGAQEIIGMGASGALGPRVPAPAIRREDARVQRDLFRPDDGLLRLDA